jgi:Zn-dependent protease
MSRTTGLIVAVISSLVSWVVYYLFLAHYQYPEPVFLATILLVAIVAHELCHVLAMERCGIKTHFFIGAILGGAFPDPKYARRFQQLRWEDIAGITLAGVCGNILMMLATAMLWMGNVLTDASMSRILNLNAGLIAFNLLPLGILDGGRFAKALFDSVEEHLDHVYAIVIWAGALFAMGITTYLYGKNAVFFALLLNWGLRQKATHDDPNGSFNFLAIPRAHQKWWALAYTILIGVGLFFEANTLVWLK